MCSANQECVATTSCPFTKQLNTLIQISSNEYQKNTLKEVIDSMACGDPSADTVCCDSTQGKISLFYLITRYSCLVGTFSYGSGLMSR